MIASISFGVDYTPDDVETLEAYTEEGGVVIPEDTWQTDSEVFFDWNDSESTSPIVGYSWALNSTPDFSVDIISPGVIITLPEGENIINVRAIDIAGNLGPVTSYNIRNTDVIYTLNYLSDGNGTISGEASQIVRTDDDGSGVEAIPNSGYEFVQWSDGSTDNPRTDLNVTEDITVTATFALLTGVRELPELDISCYPNPCSEYFILRFNMQTPYKDLSYHILDLNGRLIKQGALESGETLIDTRELKKSLYVIKVINSGKQVRSAFITKM